MGVWSGGLFSTLRGVYLQSSEEVRGRVHELLQSPAWSRAWLAVLDNLPAPADDELERAGLGWLMGGFPWAHGYWCVHTHTPIPAHTHTHAQTHTYAHTQQVSFDTGRSLLTQAGLRHDEGTCKTISEPRA